MGLRCERVVDPVGLGATMSAKKVRSVTEKAKARKKRLEIGYPLKGRGTRRTQPPARGGGAAAKLFDKVFGRK